jgi:hypothetical protein
MILRFRRDILRMEGRDLPQTENLWIVGALSRRTHNHETENRTDKGLLGDMHEDSPAVAPPSSMQDGSRWRREPSLR